MRHKSNVAKPPLLAQTGWFSLRVSIGKPPRPRAERLNMEGTTLRITAQSVRLGFGSERASRRDPRAGQAYARSLLEFESAR